MNVYFPNWITADIMINTFLNDFKAHIMISYEDMKVLQFSFISFEAFYIVPEEDRELFELIYNVFADWADKEIGIASIAEKYVNYPVDKRTLNNIEQDIQNAMCKYENEKGIELKQILAVCFGISATPMLPKEISERLQVLAKIKEKIERELEEN